MRKLKDTVTDINIESDKEWVSVQFTTEPVPYIVVTKHNVSDGPPVGGAMEESRFTLWNCNPEQIANELLKWCESDNELENDGSYYISPQHPMKHHMTVGFEEISLSKGLYSYGQVTHSIPDFKQKLKVELEKCLEDIDAPDPEPTVIERIEKLEKIVDELDSLDTLAHSQQGIIEDHQRHLNHIEKQLKHSPKIVLEDGDE